MQRRHAGEHRGVAGRLVERRVVHLVELGSRDHEVAGTEDVQLAADGARGGGVVARDHDGADAGGAAGFHGLAHVGPRRVHHADEADEHEIAFDVLLVAGHAGQGAGGECQHAQRLVREPLRHGQRAGAILVGHRPRAVLVHDEGAAGQQRIDRALHGGHDLAVALVHGGHALAVGVEGALGQARVGRAQRGRVDAVVARQHQQRALGGVADERLRPRRALLGGRERGVVAQHGGEREVAEQVGVLLERLGGLERLVAVEVGAQRHAHDAHAVLGEGARLVRADDGGAAQRLDGRQAAHERLVAGHALHAQRHGDGGGGGQALGDHRDGQRHGQQQQGGERAAVGQADGQHRQRRRHAHDGEDLAERGQLALDGCVQLLVAFQHAGDVPDLGSHARGHHDARPASRGDDGGGERHVRPVSQRRAGQNHGGGVLLDGHRLARERGFLHAQPGRFDQTQVGGRHAAVAQLHEVARHEVARGHHHLHAVADDARLGRAHRS